MGLLQRRFCATSKIIRRPEKKKLSAGVPIGLDPLSSVKPINAGQSSATLRKKKIALGQMPARGKKKKSARAAGFQRPRNYARWYSQDHQPIPRARRAPSPAPGGINRPPAATRKKQKKKKKRPKSSPGSKEQKADRQRSPRARSKGNFCVSSIVAHEIRPRQQKHSAPVAASDPVRTPPISPEQEHIEEVQPDVHP